MKCVIGEHGWADIMVSRNVMSEQYVVVSKSVMCEQIMKETDGSVGLMRVNGRHGYVESMISKYVTANCTSWSRRV